MAYVCGYRPEHVGYAFMDLDGNGVKELIIGDTEYGIDGVIYALYSYADGSIKEVFSSGERDRHSLCDGGIILNDWSNSAWNNGRAYYRISGTTLSLKERIVGDKDKNGNYVQFYSTTENDQDLISITEEKAQEIRDSYVKESIQYTSFSSIIQTHQEVKMLPMLCGTIYKRAYRVCYQQKLQTRYCYGI